MTKYGLMREQYLMRWCPPVICISAMSCHSSHSLFHSELLHILRVHVPLCWLLVARISVWVLWEHDKVERAEMTEGVNSIPAAEMAFKCLSLCTPIVLQTHYLRACLCVLVHDYKCVSELFHQSSPRSHATHPLPFCSDLFLIHHASLPVLLPQVFAKV